MARKANAPGPVESGPTFAIEHEDGRQFTLTPFGPAFGAWVDKAEATLFSSEEEAKAVIDYLTATGEEVVAKIVGA